MKAAVTLLALASSLTVAFGEGELPQRLYRVEVITMPRAAASDLITQPLDGPALHARVVEALKARQATLDKLILLKSRPGVRAIAEQADHYEYATEFDPPVLAHTLAIANPEPDKANKAAPGSKSSFNMGLGTLSTISATAFETRPLGDEVEIEPMADGTVRYALSSTELLASEHATDVSLPVFGTRTLFGQTRLKPGHAAFLGTFTHARKTGVKGQRDAENTALAFITAADDLASVADGRSLLLKQRALRATLEVLSIDKAAAHALVLETADEQAIYDHVAKHGSRVTSLAVRGAFSVSLAARNADELIAPSEIEMSMGSPQPPDLGSPVTIAGIPPAYETTTLGDSLGVEFVPVNDDLEVRIDVRLTHLSGSVPISGIQHPVVETRQLSTSISTVENRRTLLGTVSKPFATGFDGSNKENRVWFAFLRLSK